MAMLRWTGLAVSMFLSIATAFADDSEIEAAFAPQQAEASTAPQQAEEPPAPPEADGSPAPEEAEEPPAPPEADGSPAPEEAEEPPAPQQAEDSPAPQEATPDLRDFDRLFRSHEPLQIRIAAPLRTLVRERPDEEDLVATATWTEDDGRTIEVDIGIRTRGHYRRQPRTCPFAPIRLNFRTSEVDDTVFHKQDKLKLVTHCKDRSRSYTQNLLKEYVAYRMLNELTDLSYQVRLAQVNYVDTEGYRDESVEFAFIIEDKSRFAKRTGLPVVEIPGTEVAALDPAYTNLVSLFEFFIANTDFSPVAGAKDDNCCHNTNLFGGDGTLLFAVPYDFDFSGIVNADYASPNPRFRLRSVRQRLYRGRCINNPHLDASIQRFLDERDDIYALIEAESSLSNSTRRRMTNFIDDFYEIINDPRLVQRKLVDACISP